MDLIWRSILVPIAFDEMAHSSVELALALARSAGASVHVLHAIDAPVVAPPELIITAGAGVFADLERSARASLDEIVQRHAASGVAMTSSVRVGAATTVIPDVVAELAIDLVVIGTHGRRGLSRALLGSVAEKVVRTTKVPVLVVPAHARQPADPSSITT